MDATSMAVAQAWVDAANACDGDRLTALSDPNVEIVGPRGSARGPAVLRDWLGRAGVTLATRCGFARGEAVVLEQHGVWKTPGAPPGEAEVASRFRVRNGRVVAYERHDDLVEALAVAGLTSLDKQPNVGSG